MTGMGDSKQVGYSLFAQPEARLTKIVAYAIFSPTTSNRIMPRATIGELEPYRSRTSKFAPVPPSPLIIYPELPGLSWPVVRRAIWQTGQDIAAGSGRSTRAKFATWPTWEWDLTYDYLPDAQASGLTASDYRDLAGFFLARGGAWKWFCYRDSVFNAVAGELQMTGDGTTRAFVLSYTAGLAPYSIFEPIGALNTQAAFTVYVGGSPILPAAYSLDTGTPHNQVVTLNAPPPNDVEVRVDMAFYYAVTFADDVNDFEEFMGKLWAAKKISLRSVV